MSLRRHIVLVILFCLVKGLRSEVILNHNTHDDESWCINAPCIRKCCPEDAVIQHQACTTNLSIEFTIKNYEGTQEINTTVEFNVIHDSSCKTGTTFKLNPARYIEDQFYVQKNGTLFKLNDPIMPTVSYDNYCLDTFILPNGTEELLALVCYSDDDLETVDDKHNACAGMIVSMPFLLLTFIIFLILPERTLHRRALMQYVITLLAAYITLVYIQLYPDKFSEVPCNLFAYSSMFWFLVSFFWMNVMCIDMSLAFSGMRSIFTNKEAERKRQIIYCLYAWGVPVLHILIDFLINTYADENSPFHPQIGKTRCFLGGHLPTFLYFYLTVAIILGINVTLFIITAVRIQRIKKETAVLKRSDNKRHLNEDDGKEFKLYLKLMLAMGINWVMEVVATIVQWSVENTPTFIFYVTDFANGAYGVIIFIIFVCNKKTWRTLQQKYYICIRKPNLAKASTNSPSRNTISENVTISENILTSEANETTRA